MNPRTFALLAMLLVSVRGPSAAAQPGPYSAIEVDRFVPAPTVAFPADYQSALVDDLAREASLKFQSIILREGQSAPSGYVVLRISGRVTRFKPGNKTKRYLIGFGAGATVVEAQVSFTDAGTGKVLLTRTVKGVTWTGLAGGDSKSADESLARKIVKLCNAAHLMTAAF
jgi:Domain of unknown function (DUF4410)